MLLGAAGTGTGGGMATAPEVMTIGLGSTGMSAPALGLGGGLASAGVGAVSIIAAGVVPESASECA